MLERGNTLHFINRVDGNNCGDMMACPLLYYYDYFKQYRIKRHDIRFIDYESISSSDVVILGGGGLLDYSESMNRAIDRVLDTGAAVIAWAPGFNTHRQYCDRAKTQIHFERFAALGVRDDQNTLQLPYLPDVSCKLEGLRRSYTMRREIGIAAHKDYPIEGLSLDAITNARSMDEILQFIGESEAIISNSFHMIYWSILMGKKTVCMAPFSSKFYSYRYKPEYCSGTLQDAVECVGKAQRYHVLEECVEMNNAFFQQVKEIIEGRLTPERNPFALYDWATQEAFLREAYREPQLQEGDMLIAQLFVDEGSGFSEENKLISINNVYGDDTHTIRFDLSGFSNLRGLRFDPLEAYFCQVKMLRVESDRGPLSYRAKAAVNADGWDRFLTTDPQYYIEVAPQEQSVTVVFSLRLLSHSEAESNLYGFLDHQDCTMETVAGQLRDKEAALQRQAEVVREQSGQIEWQTARIQEQDERLCQCAGQLQEQREELERSAQRLRQQDEELERSAQRLRCQDEELQAQSERIQAQGGQIREQLACMEQQSRQITQMEEHIARQTFEAEQMSVQLDTLYHSTCWRITAPLRIIGDFIKRLRKGINKNATE